MKNGYNKWFYVVGGPLLLMELTFLLRGVGVDQVCWITIQKPPGKDEVIYRLEKMMLDCRVQVHLYNFKVSFFYSLIEKSDKTKEEITSVK
ncbi:putative Glycosyl-transferase family 4_5 [Helianthus anomalus]